METPKFKSLDSGTQYKIFDRAMLRIRALSTEQVNDRAMEAVEEIIEEETATALSENAGRCEECDFDQTFICPDCGYVQ